MLNQTDSGQAMRRPAYAQSAFHPAWWLPGAHGQTIAGRLLRRPRLPAFRRERLELPDGDFVDLDFAPGGRADRPLVVVLHGLEGSARRGYAIHTYDQLAKRGLRAAGLNFRSCSGEPNRTARFYHSGDTGDVRDVLATLSARGTPVAAAIGFSLGGNVLLKFLGEEGEAAPLRAAAAVSVPYDLAAGADALEATRMGRFYTRRFLKPLTAKAEAKAALLDGRCDLARIRAARTFRQFDDAATAPLHGFANAADYYARSSSAGFLERIRVPTLLLHAEDDPFLPPSSLPLAAIAANPWLRKAYTLRGGHVGFVAGQPWAPRFWAEEEVVRFVDSALEAS
jgi:hypothetical protein